MEKYKAKKNEENQEKTEKEKQQDATAHAVKVAGKTALDAYTGGTISQFENVPVLGDKIDKKFDQLSNFAAKRINKTPIVGKSVGKLATKLEDSGITDTAEKMSNMLNFKNSPNGGTPQIELNKDSLNDEILNKDNLNDEILNKDNLNQNETNEEESDNKKSKKNPVLLTDNIIPKMNISLKIKLILIGFLAFIIIVITYISNKDLYMQYATGAGQSPNLGGQSSNLGGTTTNEVNGTVKSGNVNIETINGITYVNGILIVNKTYSLPSDFVPSNTYENAAGQERCPNCIDKDVYSHFQEMVAQAATDGINLFIASGYRSYTYQDGLYKSYVNRDGKEKADTYSARPGHSEHQTGLAMDINSASSTFDNTPEAKWLSNNAYKFGFILRYPNGKSNITGYKYESWHYRYVGVDLATTLYNNGNWVTLEEYFDLDSKYS